MAILKVKDGSQWADIPAITGEDGVTFTPSVSSEGVISWINDGGLPNPQPVNIKGPKGDDGDVSSVNGISPDGSGNVTIPNATQSASGLMSNSDKTKLDGLPTVVPGANLLDNWYFVGGGSQQGGRQFPINQRGQTSYSVAERYCIDRWRLTNSGTVSITSDCIAINNSDWGITEYFGLPLQSGIEYTLSFLARNFTGTRFRLRFADAYSTTAFTDNEIEKISGNSWELITKTIKAEENIPIYGIGFDSFGDITSIEVKAIKLEIGNHQTLAHQENGVWVLNDPPPDYDTELLKCQTSTADSDDTYANKQLIPAERNAGAHNAIYRGKYLGNAVTAAQYSAISAGTFDDLFIGDYWTINNVNWRIAAFDYWLHTGDTECATHHVVIVPDTALTTGKMNSTDIVTGAYVGSDFYTGNNNNTAKANATTIIEAAFGQNHILSHRERFPNAVKSGTGRVTADAHYDSMVDLMNEPMVYGHYAMDCNLPDGTTEPSSGGDARRFTFDATQLPLFSHSKDKIIIRGVHWWLRDTTSPSKFTNVFDTGISGASNASAVIGIRPAFGIVG